MPNEYLVNSFLIRNNIGENIRIKRLSAEDITALQHFNTNLSEQTRSQFLPHKYDQKTISKFVDRNDKGIDRIYVALSDDKVVAYFFLWDLKKRFPVLGVGITESHQRQGLGKQLMAILINDAKEARSDGIVLTTVLTNVGAYQLYLKMGFIYLGIIKNKAGDGRIVEERMMYLPIIENAVPELQDIEPPDV